MWAETNPSPTRSQASAPALTEAFTAPVSPRTITVTYPPPTSSLTIKLTSAAFVIASAASIAGTNPRVSIIPNAIPEFELLSKPLSFPIGFLVEAAPLEPLDKFLALGIFLVLDVFSVEGDCIFEEVFI